MTTDEILDIFRQCGALLEGHFILSSGLRSPVFLQKQRVFMHPDQAEKLCRALAEKLRAEGYGNVSQIVSPAIGGIIPGYETARHLGVPAIFTERVDGKFQLRRGFEVQPGEKVLVVEDIVTTGLSIRECIECLRELGADVVAAACLIDRSGGEAEIGVPLVALTPLQDPRLSRRRPAARTGCDSARKARQPGSRMIVGLGNDLCDISRVQQVLDKYGERFTHRCFTEIERQKSDRRAQRAASYAKRFAAKEACSKALGHRHELGRLLARSRRCEPAERQTTMKLTNGAARALSRLVPAGHEAHIHLTITDDGGMAQAFVIIEALPIGGT